MAENDKPPYKQPGLLSIHAYPLTMLFVWGVVVVLVLHFFRPLTFIGLGFLATAAVWAMLKPIADHMVGPRWLRAIIAGIIFIIGVGGALTLLVWVLIKPIRQQLNQWPQVKQNLDSLLAHWAHVFGVRPLTVDELGNQLAQFVLGEQLKDVLGIATDVLATGTILLIFIMIGSIYLLAERPGGLVNPVLRILPPARVIPMRLVFADLEPRLRWWLIGTIISMTGIGIVAFVGYSLIGLHFALPLAVFAGLAEIVPTVGPATTFVLSVLLALTQGVTQVLGVLIVYIVIQLFEANILIPLVMRSVVDIPPVVSLFTIILWGKIFGIAGLLLAIPIDLLIWTVADHFLIRPHDTS